MPQHDVCAAFLWRNDTSNLQKPNLKSATYRIVFNKLSDWKPARHFTKCKNPLRQKQPKRVYKVEYVDLWLCICEMDSIKEVRQ